MLPELAYDNNQYLICAAARRTVNRRHTNFQSRLRLNEKDARAMIRASF